MNPLQLSEAADLLQEADLHYLLDEECNKACDESETNTNTSSSSESINVLTYELRIQADMMCTWQSKQDTCHGDSGGPIYLEAANTTTPSSDERDQYVQVGIVSWGEDCADDI